MSSDAQHEAHALVREARDLYLASDSATRLLEELEMRLQEPLRLAIAGIVKAGKSTLLNAMLGSGSPHRRRGVHPCRDLVPVRGQPVHHPASPRRPASPASACTGWTVRSRWTSGTLCRGRGTDRHRLAIPSPQVSDPHRHPRDRLPLAGRIAPVHGVPGPGPLPGSADAIVHLIRHLHPMDVGFLEAFRDTAAGPPERSTPLPCSPGPMSSDPAASTR